MTMGTAVVHGVGDKSSRGAARFQGLILAAVAFCLVLPTSLDGQVIRTVGQVTSLAPSVAARLGKVLQIAVDRSGRIAIRTEAKGIQRITVLHGVRDSTGVDLSLSRLGEPGDIAFIVGGRAILALDHVMGRLVPLAVMPRDSSLLGRPRDLDLGLALSMCAMDGKAFVLGWRDTRLPGNVIQVVDWRTGARFAFGAPFGDSPNPLVQQTWTAGQLLCLPDQHLVVLASRDYPEVRAYDEDGRLQWTTGLNDFRRFVVTQVPRGVRYGLPPDSLFDQVRGLFQVDSGTVAVQVVRRKGWRGAERIVRTELLAVRNGRVEGVQGDLPVVAAAWNGWLATVDAASGKVAFLRYIVK